MDPNFLQRLFQHTELEHTPEKTPYQQAISRDSFHGSLGGLPGDIQLSWRHHPFFWCCLAAAHRNNFGASLIAALGGFTGGGAP